VASADTSSPFEKASAAAASAAAAPAAADWSRRPPPATASDAVKVNVYWNVVAVRVATVMSVVADDHWRTIRRMIAAVALCSASVSARGTTIETAFLTTVVMIVDDDDVKETVGDGVAPGAEFVVDGVGEFVADARFDIEYDG